MGKEPEPLHKFERVDIERISEALYKTLFESDCEFSLKRHNHPNYDPYEESHLIPQFYWTLTAKPKGSQLEATMIVRGQSWTQMTEFWFSQDGVDYACRSDTIDRSEGLKQLRDAFWQKAAEIHDAQLASKEEIERQQEEKQKIETVNKADSLISSITRH